MRGALEGVRVVELSQGFSPSAVAGRLFAELGATVVKVENERGDSLRRQGHQGRDGVAYIFHMIHVNKRSVSYGSISDLNRKLDGLLRWADVLITDQWGITALKEAQVELRSLEASFPSLVVCAVTPFGLEGPLASWRGNELAVQCTSGIASTTGPPGGPPRRVGVSLGAFAGGILSVVAVIAALFARETGGKGQLIDMATHDCLLFLLGSTHAPVYFITGGRPVPQGNRHPMAAPWNCYKTQDGWIQICTMSDAQWRALLELMGRRDLMEDRELASVEGRVKHVERVDRVVGDWCRTLRTGDLLGRLSEAKVPAGPVVSIRQLLSDAHFREREMIVQLSMPEGFTLEVPGSIFKLSKTPGMVIAPAPVLGEGNREFTDLTERSEVMTWREERLAPLEGVRVVEMGMHTAVPVAGRLLASMGAEVIKVEPPEGEPARRLALKIGGKESYLYQMNNTDKLSLCLDIAAERDRARLLELLRCSDVFLENFAPGTTDTWGIGPFVLQSVNQGLVYCAVTGFGHAGPLRATRAYDTIIQAMSGLMSLTGYAGTPLKVGASVADQLGACVAAAAVLAALWWRRSSGLGQFIDVSMHDICGWLTMEAWPAVLVSGQDSQQNEGCGRDGSLSDIYECEDGFVGIEIRDISELRTFMEATGVGLGDDLSPGYGEVVGSPSFAAELRELVSTWMRKRRVKDVIEALQVEGVCATPVLGLDEVLRHPHTIFRGMIRTVDVPDLGEVKVLGIPLGLARTPPQIRRAAPRLGEHNDSVFSELGASGRGLS